MIFDGYWKDELKHNVKMMKLWQKLSVHHTTYAEHQINKYILYSAIVIRKMIEEEKEAKTDFEKIREKHKAIESPDFHLLKYDIPCMQWNFKGDKDFILHRVIIDNYKEKGKEINLSHDKIYNAIVHSYIWGLTYSGEANKRRISGFLVSSDRFKEKILYYVELKDWIDYVNYCIEKSVV